MKEFTVTMAIVDYIPVIFFLMASLKYADYLKKYGNFLFTVGTFLITIAGILKATYKLIYALNLGDVVIFNSLFMPLQSIGFLIAGIGTIKIALNKKNIFNSLLPIYISMMCLGLGMMNFGLAIIANKKNKKGAIIFLVIAFVCSLMMGYLSSRNFDKAIFNWICQGINIVGQGSFLISANIVTKR